MVVQTSSQTEEKQMLMSGLVYKQFPYSPKDSQTQSIFI